MGLLDFEFGEDVSLESEDDFSWFDDTEESPDFLGFGEYEPTFEDDDTSYDWLDDTDDLFTEFEVEDLDLESLYGEDEDEDGLNVPSGVWSKLLDFGLGSLGQWMKQKDAEAKKTTKSSGGGGRVAPVTAVKKAIPVGTRTST